MEEEEFFMHFRIFQYCIFSSALFLLFSCGKSSQEEIADAVTSANILLSTRQCQAAIDLLEEIGRKNKNAFYLKALASAYACRAGYSTTTYFGSDIQKTATPAPLGGMSTYSTSITTLTSPLTLDSKFRDLQTAIDLLLYAGGIPLTTEPKVTERAKYFSASEAGDINAQLTFMMLVQLGKLIRVYGDTNFAGVKGGGGANNCFTDYTAISQPVKDYITMAGQTGACTSTSDPHAELASGASNRRKKLCEGTVLLNNILETLPSVLAGAIGGSLADVSTLTADIQAQKTALLLFDPSFSTTALVLSQSNCETDTNIDLTTLSSYYAVFFETLIK